MSTFSVVATLTLSTTDTLIRNSLASTRIRCCSDSKRKRGFGPQQDDKDANKVSGGDSLSRGRKSTFQQSGTTSKSLHLTRRRLNKLMNLEKSNMMLLSNQHVARLNLVLRLD